jgi:putative FmdB family regulatory protein
MPTYEYHCSACGHKLEQMQKITEAPLLRCPECNQDTLRRGPGGGIGLSFTGSGFYITDYKQSKNNESPNTPQKETPSSSDKTDQSSCACGKKKGSCSSSS